MICVTGRLLPFRLWVLVGVTLLAASSTMAGSPADPIHVKVHARVLHRIDARLFGQFMEKASWGGEIGSETATIPGAHSLRPQAEELIRQGGPFTHAKDGSVFGNLERLLPPRARGFYREYTVSTPGARDRGARRIVCGGHPPERPEACYYTDDHYANFRLIVK